MLFKNKIVVDYESNYPYFKLNYSHIFLLYYHIFIYLFFFFVLDFLTNSSPMLNIHFLFWNNMSI